MATRQVLAELGAAFTQRTGCAVAIEAVGGVDAARRVAAGEAFDVVILASDAIDRLIAGGHLKAGSRVDLVRSEVAIAVRAGAAVPDVGSEDALKRAVLAARNISYSTGPSGVALAALFERWGIADEVRGRTVQAPPGVPVGTLVARGEVELGFQQLSELIHVDGITLVGGLPRGVEITTYFSAGLPVGLDSDSPQGARVRALIEFMASPDAEAAKRRQGMEPA
ncbi:substrate-binding domain-containing protein [Hydrogenophaga laconesensis]|uniref:Molybdate transport system substrate-binding protein n=1 Tax=Hydrogenophaga laconesensis TaxID=1805971 RepID=A0ABU1V9D7_9BURK|nr:substrate-binding domain-containing protein [Hydrogenophaga laconesensis]MDR7094071.1 molybdate transport system substrate-binding protein [Hydrogenophaga laconesensis]